MRILLVLALVVASACTDPAVSPPVDAAADRPIGGPEDDGTFLTRIDPLGGEWRVETVGSEDFTVYHARVDFSAGAFLNHSAGCSGGYSAFYALNGEQLTVTRLEPIRIGKCSPASPTDRERATDSERKLAVFLDQVAGWRKTDARTVVLTAKDGEQARLKRPVEPYPELAGRWIIEGMGGEPLVTERRPPTLTIAMGSIGAYADCNGMGGSFTVPAPEKISIDRSLVSTAIGCPPEDAAEDALMAEAMTSATAYELRGDRLILTGGPGMLLRRPPPANRKLAGVYASCGNTLPGGYHEGPITLTVGGQAMRDNAGCAATYAVDEEQLTLSLADGPACTNPAPPYEPGKPAGIGGHISMLAVAQPDGFGFDDQGRLILRTGRGLLTMCREGDPPPFGG